MADVVEIAPKHSRELVIARLMDASPEQLYRAWTEAEVLATWFAPAPLTTEVHELDVRPGGAQRITMRDPNTGAEYPAGGVYLELVPGRRIVGTSALAAGWEPSESEFNFVMDLSFEPQADGRTLYVARARHWTDQAAETHRQMGFHEGWGICAAQLEAAAKDL